MDLRRVDWNGEVLTIAARDSAMFDATEGKRSSLRNENLACLSKRFERHFKRLRKGAHSIQKRACSWIERHDGFSERASTRPQKVCLSRDLAESSGSRLDAAVSKCFPRAIGHSRLGPDRFVGETHAQRGTTTRVAQAACTRFQNRATQGSACGRWRKARAHL